MAVPEGCGPGDFCWVELATSDAASARSFYGRLFGWTSQPVAEGASFCMFHLDGRDAGAVYPLTADQRKEGVRPHWMAYVAVENADRAVEQARLLGGRALAGPQDVGEAGRMALIADPQGARLGLWQARNHAGLRTGGVPGGLNWCELVTPDAPGALDFYTALFGWEAVTEPAGEMPYTEWVNRAVPIGGLLQATGDWEVTPHWMPYFRVEDCEAAALLATRTGGHIKVPACEMPDVGRFAVLEDPQGAAFSVIQLARSQAAAPVTL
ncbi:MAG: VOC family protein [Bryobacterales bacterium]|nr:VOC family protein [Bryobacterales bacterium]